MPGTAKGTPKKENGIEGLASPAFQVTKKPSQTRLGSREQGRQSHQPNGMRPKEDKRVNDASPKRRKARASQLRSRAAAAAAAPEPSAGAWQGSGPARPAGSRLGAQAPDATRGHLEILTVVPATASSAELCRRPQPTLGPRGPDGCGDFAEGCRPVWGPCHWLTSLSIRSSRLMQTEVLLLLCFHSFILKRA